MAERTKINTKMPERNLTHKFVQRQKTDLFQPVSSPADRILFLQRTVGNKAVQRLLKFGVIQAKLKIDQPNDVYEQEAGRVADIVMRMTDKDSISLSENNNSAFRIPHSAIQMKPG